MSSEGAVCPKCGGSMIRGALQLSVERMAAQPMRSFMPDAFMGGFGSMEDLTEGRVLWEERTGEKKGLIFKRDETRRMTVAGLRCTLCGYVELYVQEK